MEQNSDSMLGDLGDMKKMTIEQMTGDMKIDVDKLKSDAQAEFTKALSEFEEVKNVEVEGKVTTTSVTVTTTS